MFLQNWYPRETSLCSPGPDCSKDLSAGQKLSTK